ncbi:hypothetical protein EYF80_018062 [Liparis tanakae]|uniref:Uncharacterized protein n=1 Tax=Liparis tanakae TaxID=230148 RepID=A0A4Z2I1M0_9TELE|nr:hypothetical protein EYF80_018062 [Liparis tanakae]
MVGRQKVKLARLGPKLSLVANIRRGRLMKKLRAQTKTNMRMTRSMVGGWYGLVIIMARVTDTAHSE